MRAYQIALLLVAVAVSSFAQEAKPVAERVAAHKRVRAVRLADAIPRTPSGKLLRRALRDQDRQTV